jgi:adenine-specific DNA methylase
MGGLHARPLPEQGPRAEPSLDGAFFAMRDCVGIESTRGSPPPGAKLRDFFDYPLSEQFDTIIGNPPYVRFQDVAVDTKKRSNLISSTGAATSFCSSSRNASAT